MIQNNYLYLILAIIVAFGISFIDNKDFNGPPVKTDYLSDTWISYTLVQLLIIGFTISIIHNTINIDNVRTNQFWLYALITMIIICLFRLVSYEDTIVKHLLWLLSTIMFSVFFYYGGMTFTQM